MLSDGEGNGGLQRPVRVNDAAYWRDCAKRARAEARRLRDPQLQAKLRAIAVVYARLAREAGRRGAWLPWVEAMVYGRPYRDGVTPADGDDDETPRGGDND